MPSSLVGDVSLQLWLPVDAGDGVLRWVEAYAAALLSGRFAIELLDAEMSESRAISLFPQVGLLHLAAPWPWANEQTAVWSSWRGKHANSFFKRVIMQLHPCRFDSYATMPQPSLSPSPCLPRPQLPPWGSEAVTRGVRVRALPVFVPEQTMVRAGADGGDDVEGDNQYLFAYRCGTQLLGHRLRPWPRCGRGASAVRGVQCVATTGRPVVPPASKLVVLL